MSTHYDEFAALVRPWLLGYDRVSFAAIGVKKGDERRILAAKIELLSSFANVPKPERELKDPIFWGITKVVPFSMPMRPNYDGRCTVA